MDMAEAMQQVRNELNETVSGSLDTLNSIEAPVQVLTFQENGSNDKG